MKRIAAMLLTSVLLLSCVGCAQDGRKEPGAEKADLGLTAEVKPATDFTAKANAAVYDELDFDDKQEYEFATRGLIDAPETLELKDEDGTILWSQEAYAFLDDYEKAPDSVNPSLWENTKNNHAYGLFEVTDGIYQVRGYDMANLTVVKGDTGWIVFDTLMSVECSQAAMQLIEKNLGKFPVKAVIISHSHADHFGGIAGVMAKEDKADETLSIEDQLASGKIPVITPVGFTEHSVKENVYAGKGMGRRSNYQYGILLTPGVTGKLAQGIGMGQSTGTVSFMTPSYEITQSGEKLTIDGVELEFQLTPGTEAPAEMNTWLPQYKALWMAENCTGTLHNLYTLRGAEVRDGAAWASYITEAISLYGKEAEVTFQSHNWPHWGNDVVNDYMVNTAAVYKYINDQTLTYINQGYTSDEISNMIELPEALNKIWYTRQYYGTVAHNAKAVYQKFMGWYDSNPVNLNPLMPSDSAKKWVEYLGDVDKVLQMAKADFDKGEYQWVAEVTNTIVFADPTNTDARLLCADALEQLGYQAESGPWRNEYLTAAQELRHGNANFTASTKSTGDMVKALSAPMLFDYMAIVMDKQALADRDFTMNVILPDVGEQHMLRMHLNVMKRYQYLTQAMVEIAQNRPDAALLTLSPLERYIQGCGRHIDGIHLNILCALALYRKKDNAWRARLTAALDTATEYGFITPVSVYSAAVLPLLEKLNRNDDTKWYKRLMAAVRTQATYYPRFLAPRMRAAEELTPTELQILRLICADKSNAEIAQIMNIKLPTVKTHVSHILDKLDVNRRAEAKTAAKKLRLIPDDL